MTCTASSSAASPAHLRHLYRSLLRELPRRRPPPPAAAAALLDVSRRSTLHAQLRARFSGSETTFTSTNTNTNNIANINNIANTNTNTNTNTNNIAIATELANYLRAQRTYTTLLDRYNPSLRDGGDDDDDMQAERVRLTARRVGMRLPRGGEGEQG